MHMFVLQVAHLSRKSKNDYASSAADNLNSLDPLASQNRQEDADVC